MTNDDTRYLNEETRDSWNATAAVWDQRMGDEGNDFHQVLVWPATSRLLMLRPGDRVLDIACGTGLTTRRLAALGAEVVAFDFAEQMIACARARTKHHSDRIEYHVLDATNESALLSLGDRRFDAAVSAMALMDMAQIDPLMRALAKLLRLGGYFVFSVMHPCFNSVHVTMVSELQDRDGELVTEYSLKLSRYLQPSVAQGLALRNQPKPHLYFHRPLHVLFGAAFNAGFVLDALEEPSFPENHLPDKFPLTWGRNFSQIPPVVVVRMRLASLEREHPTRVTNSDANL